MNKVCFVATDAVSFNVLYRDQLEFLNENGFNLTLICGGAIDSIKKLQERKVGKVINIGMRRKPHIVSDLICLFRLWWHFLFNRYDLVVVTTPKAILLGGVAACFSLQKKRISFFRGRTYENYIGFKRRLYVFLDYLSIRFTHKALFVSPSLKAKYLHELSIVATKGDVIGGGSGNGVNLNRFNPCLISDNDLSQLRFKLGVDSKEFIFISVGRICKDKGMLDIYSIANLLCKDKVKFRILLLGVIEDSTFGELYRDLLENKTVIHIDHVDDVRPYLALADLHLFLTYREGFGNVAVEAAAMNVPTIAYDVVGVADSVLDGISGVKFSFGDVNSIVQTLQEYMCNKHLLKEFSGARKWVASNYSQEQVWNRYKDFFLATIEE